MLLGQYNPESRHNLLVWFGHENCEIWNKWFLFSKWKMAFGNWSWPEYKLELFLDFCAWFGVKKVKNFLVLFKFRNSTCEVSSWILEFSEILWPNMIPWIQFWRSKIFLVTRPLNASQHKRGQMLTDTLNNRYQVMWTPSISRIQLHSLHILFELY